MGLRPGEGSAVVEDGVGIAVDDCCSFQEGEWSEGW